MFNTPVQTRGSNFILSNSQSDSDLLDGELITQNASQAAGGRRGTVNEGVIVQGKNVEMQSKLGTGLKK